MSLIKVLKDYSIDKLEEAGFEPASSPEWVQISFGEDDDYEVNRYDMQYDEDYYIYVYYSEGDSEIVAVDSLVENKKNDVYYVLDGTVVGDALSDLKII